MEQVARRHAEDLERVELVGDDERILAAAVMRARAPLSRPTPCANAVRPKSDRTMNTARGEERPDKTTSRRLATTR